MNGRRVVALALLAGVASAWAATIALRPGEWRVTSQVWLDGKEVLGALDAAGKQATDEVLRKMPPAERARVERDLPPRESLSEERECITPAEASMDAREALQQAVAGMHQPPWACSFANQRADGSGVSLEYRCTTSAGARAEGRARFEASRSRYRGEVVGRSHAVDMATGRPLQPRLVDARSLTEGLWVAERCSR